MSKQVIGEKEAAEGPNKRAKVALPTKDEQKQLQQVELLMKSNLLQLQVNQILEEVSGEAIMGKKRVIEWAAGLVQLLKSVDSFKGLSGTALNKKTIKKLGLKSINQLALVNGSDESMKVEFLPPAAADLVGSTENHTSLSAMFNIDIAVTMPASMFESRDILNHRYFDKRKLYLLGLYQALQKHSGEDHALYSAASFAAFKSDLRKPILVLQAPFTVSRAGSAGVTARIIPVIAEEGVFRAVQLRAGKNNVRPSHWGSTSEDATGAEEGKDAASLPPTPLYNLAILEDMAVLTQHRILQKTVAPSSALAKALTLFKIWLTQRGFRFAADGFDGHCAGLLLSYLLLTRRVAGGAATSPLSAFQTMLTFIAEGHLLQCGLDFRSADLGSRKNIANVHASAGMGGLASNGGVLMPDDSAVAISSDLKHSSVLDERSWDFKRPLSLIHPLGMQTGGAESCRYNSLWRVSASAANMLQSEAVRSLKELQHQENACCFDHLFMQRRSFYERHDQFYHLRVEGQTLPFLANSSIHVGKEQAEVSPAFRAISEMPAAARKELRSILLHVPAPEHFAAAAVQVVSKGLGDRAVSVHSLVRCVSTTSADSDTTEDELEVSAHTPVWTVPPASDAAADSKACDWIVSIGVVLDREKMDRRVERGPTAAQANIPDIAADPALFHSNGNGNSAVVDDELHRFRNFWGPKVQLRRFKDGAIMESVVWETAPMGGGVVEQVAKFLLGRHLPAVCGGDGSLVRAVNSQLESAVLASSLGTGSSSDDMQSRRAVEALDKLRTVLTSQIKRLPLAYEALMAAAPELRYTAIQAPSQHPFVLAASGAADEGSDKALKRILKQYAGRNVSLLTTPMRVLVQAESSGKWPLEAEAISKAKLAMLLKTKTELKSQFQIQSVIHEDCLDVCYEGYLFRLQIVATPEIEAIQMAAAVRGSVSGTQEIQRAVVRNVVVPPLHHLSVRALRAQFPSYSGAVRLLALWAAQHYFSGHLCLELIELIVAYEYLHPFTSQPPSSPMAGFYRALLRLADHNWDADPLVVDLSGESKEITGNSALQLQIVTQFRSVRDPAAIAALEEAAVSGDLDAAARRHLNAPMYIVSSADKAHGYWPSLAERSPERVVLAMIVRTAKLSAQRLLGWIQRSYSEASVEEAAIASILGDRAVLDKCDVVLKVNKALLNKNPKEGPTFATLSVFANTSAAEASISNLVVCEAECAAHPIQEDLVRKLRRAFGNSALFFWNSSSGREIGLIWRPRILQPSSFAVLACKGRQVCEAADSTMTEANMPQLLCEMLDVADGLVVQAEEVSK